MLRVGIDVGSTFTDFSLYYASLEAAERVYGGCLDARTLMVDEHTTLALRTQRRTEAS